MDTLLINLLRIGGGVVLLYIGGELLVRSAITISVRFGISRLIIGLTVVALGTSLPELFVSLTAALSGAPEISAANIVGSNIINIALILPLIPLFAPLVTPRRLRRVDYPMMLLAFVLTTLLIIDWRGMRGGADGGGGGGIALHISLIDGVVLLLGLAGYLVYLVRTARDEKSRAEKPRGKNGARVGGGLLLCAVGGGALAVGSNLLVTGAEMIATTLGVSRRIIALTIVAHGTNLPEIFAAIAALRKRESEVAIGNIIGSNIINTLFILGVIGVISPLTIRDAGVFLADLGWLIAIGLYIYLLLLSVKDGARVRRWHGGVILLSYIGYFVWVMRGAAAQ